MTFNPSKTTVYKSMLGEQRKRTSIHCHPFPPIADWAGIALPGTSTGSAANWLSTWWRLARTQSVRNTGREYILFRGVGCVFFSAVENTWMSTLWVGQSVPNIKYDWRRSLFKRTILKCRWRSLACHYTPWFLKGVMVTFPRTCTWGMRLKWKDDIERKSGRSRFPFKVTRSAWTPF